MAISRFYSDHDLVSHNPCRDFCLGAEMGPRELPEAREVVVGPVSFDSKVQTALRAAYLVDISLDLTDTGDIDIVEEPSVEDIEEGRYIDIEVALVDRQSMEH
jgi:hypothetical protein